MAIQILGLRDYFNKKQNRIMKKETFFDKQWRAESVPELFANLDKLLEEIPKEEQYNLYYTASRCLEERGRKLESQNIIPLDLDDIDETKLEEYITVVLKTLTLDRDKTGIVFSGNGLQFIIATKETIDHEEYFDESRLYYKALCGELATALYEAGLPATVDPVVFSSGRLLRLPNTINKKPSKGEKQARLIQGNIQPIDFDLIERSGIPVIEYNEQISDGMLDRLPPPDTEGVLNGCDFIQHCKDNQNEVSEPEWYALLSILGRLDGGRELCHTYSKDSGQYNPYETDRKLEQAISASGPRTCDSISNMFSGCPACPNWGKCKSPITIKSEGFIKTKETGFYNIKIGKGGIPEKGKPNYNDLLKFFNSKHPFITLSEGSMTYTWTGTHYDDFSTRKIDSFAEEHFDPAPDNKMCNEFRGKILRNNIRNPEWFGPQGVINFANGLLDISTMELNMHNKDKGLRYVLPFDHDLSADCPRFTQFLDEITLGDREVQQVLLEYMGYSLSGIDPSFGQKALILVGNGSNGKSVFMDVLKFLAGEGNYSTLSMGSEIGKLENRYQLDGKLFNISEETPNNAMMDSTVFKAIVAGGEVQARKLYCDAYSMRSKAKIILACNKLPPTRDLSYGMFRRLLIAPFNAKFREDDPNYDPDIREKLYAEASGIFNLCFKALLTFKRNKVFSSAKAIKSQIQAYKDDNDGVATWWDDSVVPCNEATEVAARDLYNMYKIDTEQEGQKPENLVWFGRKIREIVDDEARFKRKRVNGKLVAVISGYKLAEGTDEAF